MIVRNRREDLANKLFREYFIPSPRADAIADFIIKRESKLIEAIKKALKIINDNNKSDRHKINCAIRVLDSIVREYE